MDFKVNYPNFINARECFSFTLSSALNALEDSFSQILLKKKCAILWIRIKSKYLFPNHFSQSRLILAIIIGEKDLKYSMRYESIMNPIFCTVRLENFMMSCRDNLYHRTISNKIKFNFLIILFGKISSRKSLLSSGTGSEIERMTSINSAGNHTLLNWQNQKSSCLWQEFCEWSDQQQWCNQWCEW